MQVSDAGIPGSRFLRLPFTMRRESHAANSTVDVLRERTSISETLFSQWLGRSILLLVYLTPLKKKLAFRKKTNNLA